jgi:hypothetical protein
MNKCVTVNFAYNQENNIQKKRKRLRWIQVWYIWYIVRTFENATMYSHSAQQ